MNHKFIHKKSDIKIYVTQNDHLNSELFSSKNGYLCHGVASSSDH